MSIAVRQTWLQHNWQKKTPVELRAWPNISFLVYRWWNFDYNISCPKANNRFKVSYNWLAKYKEKWTGKIWYPKLRSYHYNNFDNNQARIWRLGGPGPHFGERPSLEIYFSFSCGKMTICLNAHNYAAKISTICSAAGEIFWTTMVLMLLGALSLVGPPLTPENRGALGHVDHVANL